MKKILEIHTMTTGELKYLTWLTSYFGMNVGHYEQLKSTDNDMKFDYIGRAFSCLHMIREVNEDVYDDIHRNYRNSLQEMKDMIKNR